MAQLSRPLDLPMTLRGQFKKKQPGDDMVAGTPMLEARARIIWGDSMESVRDYLISNGISAEDADARLHEFASERNSELRKIGLRNLFVGILVTGASGITFWIAMPHSSVTIGIVKALALVLMAGCYGLWKLWTGIVYLIRPQSEHKSIPDIDQSDILE